MPADNSAAGLAVSNNIQGKYVSDVNVAGGVVTVRFGNDANTQIFGETITLTPDTSTPGSLPWICASGGVIQDRHLPAACR
jgi:type IV pilus assembly protein PilA